MNEPGKVGHAVFTYVHATGQDAVQEVISSSFCQNTRLIYNKNEGLSIENMYNLSASEHAGTI